MALGLAVLVTVASARTNALAGGGEPEAALVEGFRWAFAAAAGLALAGFADQSHLHRHFQRTLGLTPGDYRRGFRA